MSTSFWMILIPTLCYSGAAVMYAWQANWPLTITYSGYAWANVGLLWMDVLLQK